MGELEDALSKLKCDKAPGLDCLLNEFLVNGTALLKHVILRLFNCIFCLVLENERNQF